MFEKKKKEDVGNIVENVKTNVASVVTAMPVKFQKLHENAVLPSYAKEGDAGLDLTAVETWYDAENDVQVYDFGLAMEIPKGYVGLVFPRSSVYKQELNLSNAVGVVDSSYRGSVKAMFRRIGRKQKQYNVGERICQLIIIPYPTIVPEWSDTLSETSRGTGGFGSTGLK